MDKLQLACLKLGIEPGQVMAHRLYDDYIALVVDKGGAGCPKYLIKFDDLPEPPQPKPEIEPEPVRVGRSHRKGNDR